MRRAFLLVLFVVALDLRATVITFGDMPGDGSGVNRQVGSAYAALGVTFYPSTQGVCGGIGNGNPGAWGVEGTNSSQFLCLNTNPGTSIELTFAKPQNAITFDVTRAISGTGGSLTVTAYAGFTQRIQIGTSFGAVNVWNKISIIDQQITRVTCTSTVAWGLDNLYFSAAAQDMGFETGPPFPWQFSGNGSTGSAAGMPGGGVFGGGVFSIVLATIATGTDAQTVRFSQCVPAGVATYGLSSHVLFPSGEVRSGSASVDLTFFSNPDCTGPINNSGYARLTSDSTADQWYDMSGPVRTSPGTQSVQLAISVSRDPGPPEASFSAHFDNIGLTLPLFDVNGDQWTDLMWRNYSTGVDAAWNLITYTVPTSFTATTFPSTSDPAWRIVGVADMNADEQPDFIWRNSTTGGNAVWLMNGTTVSSVVPLPPAATNWQIATVADLNHDRSPDIVWRDYSAGYNAIWFMNGTSFAYAKPLPQVADINWRIAGAAEMNGDDQPDLVWRHYGSGANAVWFVRDGNVVGTAGLPGVADLNWQLAGASFFRGPGDLVWRNYSTGSNALWMMSGTSVSSTVLLPSAPDANWQIAGPK